MFFPPSKKSPAGGEELDRAWQIGEAIPVPDAMHCDSEEAWAVWNELSRRHELRFADTAPLTRPPGMSPEEAAWAVTVPWVPGAPGAALPARPKPLLTLESAMLVARRNNRVCPRPQRWTELMALLPPRKTLRGQIQPPAPPTGEAWAVTPALSRRLHFREHIEWAKRAGVLEAVMQFMQALPESDWLHMGED